MHHETGAIPDYVFGKRRDKVFKKPKDYWSPLALGAFIPITGERNIDQEKHTVDKRNTQKIECTNLNLRTYIKRLTRKTICFSKLEKMHNIVMGRPINKEEFRADITVQTHH
ncbi:IS1 family transposase [Endozoicomonas numazuensis]|uniref:IS1 family transposase n=2 Tax=Endozoicomonas numazuensis TaxID=1137799 RepID=UPI001268EA4E|nr:IS1 family transposase [Endozoicomonas numazuensis]